MQVFSFCPQALGPPVTSSHCAAHSPIWIMGSGEPAGVTGACTQYCPVPEWEPLYHPLACTNCLEGEAGGSAAAHPGLIQA